MRSTAILALRALQSVLQESVTLKKSEKGTLDLQVGHQGELCGRVGLEEILALGSGLNRDPPPLNA